MARDVPFSSGYNTQVLEQGVIQVVMIVIQVLQGVIQVVRIVIQVLEQGVI